MKAVVVEIKENKAAVLTDDGRVIAIINKAYDIGQVIQVKEPRIHIAKQLSIYAASAAAVMILGVGSWAYASPYTYVSVDVNPSIEYSVNRFDRVLSVKAVNDDGEEIIRQMDLKDLENQTIESALRMTVEQITEAGYFTEDTEGGIVITTASENDEKADELATSLQQAVEEEFINSEERVVVESYSVGLERVEDAKELGVTPGKLNLVEKLQASAEDPNSVDINQWLNKPVKEIMKATKNNKKAMDAVDQDKSNTDGDDTKSQTKDERKEQQQDKKANKENSRLEDNQNNIDDNSSDNIKEDSSIESGKPEKDKDSNSKDDTEKSNENNGKKIDKNNKNNKNNNRTDNSNRLDQTGQKQDEVTSTKENKVKQNDSKINKDNEKKNKKDLSASENSNLTDTDTSNATAGTSSEQNKTGQSEEINQNDNISAPSDKKANDSGKSNNHK